MEERRDCFGDHHCRLAWYWCNSHVSRQTGACIPDFDEYAIKRELGRNFVLFLFYTCLGQLASYFKFFEFGGALLIGIPIF